MQVLWEVGSGSVAQVHEALEPGLAYTTVATMLRKMESRGLVRHWLEGRRFIYEAAVEAGDVVQSMTGDLLDRLFAGSLSEMVSRLLETRDVGEEELDELEKLIAQRKRRT